MKTKIAVVLAILSFLSMMSLVGWVFSLHGARGLFHVEYISRLVMMILIIISIVPLLLVIIRKVSRKPDRFQVWIIVSSFVLLVIPIFTFGYLNGYFLQSAFDSTPRLTVTSGTGAHGIPDVAIIFESKSPYRHSLTWGTQAFVTTITEERSNTRHVFVLSDLEPGTEYRYRIDNGSDFRFTTPDPALSLRFAVGSDSHFGAGGSRPDLVRKMLNQIMIPQNKYDYFFILGDIVEYGFVNNQWQEAFKAFSETLSSIPAKFSAGNHDTLFTGIRSYRQYLHPPEVEIDSGNFLWHRFDVGDIHFIILNVEWSAESITEAQLKWLENELQNIPKNDWTIVLNHGFYYASGSTIRGWNWFDNPETINRITPLLEKYDVDIVFSGHAHQMEILEKAGITYVITGTFGGVPDNTRTYISPASLWYTSGKYGYVDVTIEPDIAKIIFRDPDGLEINSYNIQK